MSHPSINKPIQEKLEKEILAQMPAEDWIAMLTEVNDKFTHYLLCDDEISGKNHYANHVFHLTMLRDLFKEN